MADDTDYAEALKDIEELRQRAEQAERERDGLRREHEEDQGVIRVWRGRCERAEANNAALLGILRPLVDGVLDTRSRGDGSSLFLARDSEPGPEVLTEVQLERLLDVWNANRPGAAPLERMLALESFVTGFAEMAEGAVAHHRGPKTGMQVPYHGDFANLPPSGVSRLEWWGKAAREALKVAP